MKTAAVKEHSGVIVGNTSGNVRLLVENLFLHEQMNTAMELNKWMTDQLVEEYFEQFAALLDEDRIEYSVGVRQAGEDRFARQFRQLTASLTGQFLVKPFKVTVSSTDNETSTAKHWDVCLWMKRGNKSMNNRSKSEGREKESTYPSTNFVFSVEKLIRLGVSDWVAHLDLEHIIGLRVGIIERLNRRLDSLCERSNVRCIHR